MIFPALKAFSIFASTVSVSTVTTRFGHQENSVGSVVITSTRLNRRRKLSAMNVFPEPPSPRRMIREGVPRRIGPVPIADLVGGEGVEGTVSSMTELLSPIGIGREGLSSTNASPASTRKASCVYYTFVW